MESAASVLPSLSAMSRIGMCTIGLTVDVDDTRMGFAMCSDVGKILIFPRESPDEHLVVSKKAGAINPTHINGKGLVGAASPNLNIRLT